MRLPITDVLAALGQLAASTSNEIHRIALREALSAVQFRHAVEAALERHAPDLMQAPTIRPPSTPGAHWSPDEDDQLRSSFESGMSLDAIAERHGREPLEVAVRLHKPLALLTEQAVDEIRHARHRQRPREAEVVVSEVVAPIPVQAEVAVPVVVLVPVAPVVSVAAPTAVLAATPPAMPVAPVVSEAPKAEVVGSSNAAPAEAAAQGSSPSGKPTLTAEETKAVDSVLNRYLAKDAPKAALRTYIESEKFTGKIRPEVLTWLRAELTRLG